MQLKDKSDIMLSRSARLTAKQSAFTLLEVLMGMSLMSIMMLLLFASLRICVQNWDAGEKKIAQVSEATIVQNFLQNKLHAALPLDADFLEEKQFSFQGDKDNLQFVAAMPASAGRLGLQLFNISTKNSSLDKCLRLMVGIQPFFVQEDVDDAIEPVVILKKIKTLKLAYYGTDDDDRRDDADDDWQNDWLDRKTLPRLVSIDIELINGQVWPQLVVALKVDKALIDESKNPLSASFGIVGGKFVAQ